MGDQRKCGQCPWTKYESAAERDSTVTANASMEDAEQTPKIWVECSVRSCRAQYVVYNHDKLNVRPKCHYCRIGKVAPLVECAKCLNRVIWPKNYRSADLDLSSFQCYACTSGRNAVVDTDTSAVALSSENTTDWLVEVDSHTAIEVFNNRSLFHTVSTAGTDNFVSGVHMFPATSRALTLKGKLVQNSPAAISQSWVARRRTEVGTCSLCFSSKRKVDLMLTCGRTGCEQRVCKECLQACYGLNSVGCIINTAALSFPFCRRIPAPRTLALYGMGIQAIANLKKAVEESGTWISASCLLCGYAKQYMERVCAAGAPPVLRDWKCEDCLILKSFGVRNCPGCETPTEKREAVTTFLARSVVVTVIGAGSVEGNSTIIRSIHT